MNITIRKKPQAQGRSSLPSRSVFDARYGFWGVVTRVRSDEGAVDVLTDTGQELRSVRVASKQWVTVHDGYIAGERDLPTEKSVVFCLMPTGDLSSAFVLCSGFLDSVSAHSFFKEDGKEAIVDRISEGGWRIIRDEAKGSVTVRNAVNEGDESVGIIVDQSDAGSECVEIAVHGNTVTIDKDGIAIKTDGKLAVETSGKQTIGNATDTLGAMVDELLGLLAQLQTVGSPAAHTASPDFIANVKALQAKWQQVFA